MPRPPRSSKLWRCPAPASDIRILAFLVTVPVHKETVRPVNRDNSYEHHTRDAKGGNARQAPDRKAERTKKLGGDRQQRKACGNSVVREVLHGSLEAVAAKPPERLPGAMRKITTARVILGMSPMTPLSVIEVFP